jgi:hypothetical protein
MDYEEIYEGFYSKYFTKIEFLIKRFFIKRQNQKKAFLNSYNEVFHYLGYDFVNKHSILRNKELEKLYQIFSKRHSIYSFDELQGIFENEIKAEYDRIELSELPANYNYIKFIKEIALIEVENEISRLLSNNSRLLEMFYKLKDFDEFEIRRYGNLALEDYPIYKRIVSKLYPEQYSNFEENVNLNVYEATDLKDNIILENKNPFPLLFLNLDVYNCFLEYQNHIIDFYIDYSYLKKRLEFEKLIHYQKDNDFMKIVFEDIKLISEKNYNEYYVNGKLKSLAKSFSVQRENNFNIIFKDLLN